MWTFVSSLLLPRPVQRVPVGYHLSVLTRMLFAIAELLVRVHVKTAPYGLFVVSCLH